MPDDYLIGKVINDSYEIIEELARGGMATIYRAHQLSMNRDVAIKVLPREFLHEPTFIGRFRQEAAIAAHLEHRAIVPVYDYGEAEGVPYIVMRYMEGGSVDDALRRSPNGLPLEQVQQIVRQVASALDYAHAQDVLHRDLKPSNILLDSSGDAYITDFGIARLLTSNEKLTATGVVGTPAYMSPEQAQGFPLDGRSDIYALGVVIFEMLTGRRPFDGDTPYSVAVMQVTKPPPSLRGFNPQILPTVEAVVLKALEKDQNRRFSTATELAGALDDADLIPLAKTMQHPTSSYGTPQHQQPTPPRAMTPVMVRLDAPVPPRIARRQSSPFMLLLAATLIAVLLGALVLGIYLVLSNETIEADEPNFAATGVFRLTATASGAGLAPSTFSGQLIYTSDRSGQPDLYLLDLSTGNETRLTTTDGAEGEPSASPDGAWISYVYDPDGSLSDGTNDQAEIYLRRLGDTEARQLTSNLLEESTPAWTPDGTAIVYGQAVTEGDYFRLMRYDLETGREAVLFESVRQLESPHFSPDGRALVFASGDSRDLNSWEIRAFDFESGAVNQLTENAVPDGQPRYTLDGLQVFFLQDSSLMRMFPDGTKPVSLYEADGISGWSFSPDGSRILLSVRSPEDGVPTLFNLRTDGTDLQTLPFVIDDPSNLIWIP